MAEPGDRIKITGNARSYMQLAKLKEHQRLLD